MVNKETQELFEHICANIKTELIQEKAEIVKEKKIGKWLTLLMWVSWLFTIITMGLLVKTIFFK